MKLPNATIKEFAQIWEKQFGESLDDDTAREYAAKVLSLMLAVYRPMPRDSPP